MSILLEKEITIDENRILKYTVTTGYVKPTYYIIEGFLENGELKKTYSLSQTDDYHFTGWLDDDKGINALSFEFDKNHPLYFPLLNLLNNDNELIIDDDDTREYNLNYLSINKRNDKIYINFIDNKNDDYSIDKFKVFIKNILTDGRSKIDQQYKDTKIRLNDFFRQANQDLSRSFHQLSMEEICTESYSKDTKTFIKTRDN